PPQPIHAAAGRRVDAGRTLARFARAVLADPGGSDAAEERAMNHWPTLDHAADKGTIETLHLLLQLIGKLPLRLHPWVHRGSRSALPVAGDRGRDPWGACRPADRARPAGAAAWRAERDSRPRSFRSGSPRARMECRCRPAAARRVPLRGPQLYRVPLALSRQ